MKKELLEQLSKLEKKVQALLPTLNLKTHKTELENLQKKTQDPEFWNDQKQAQKISKQLAKTEKFIQTWEEVQTEIKELQELTQISEDAETKELEQDITNLTKKLDKEETALLLNKKFDHSDAILSIHVGTGGQDAEDFCAILLRMYLRYAEIKDYKTKILDESPSDDGLKSATIEIKGESAYGWLRSENGVHRLIRLSPFNAKNLRQTSFAKVEVIPILETEEELDINPKDIRTDVYRSSGCGGQSVNTTDSAVRLTYIPLNLVVTCQNEKSQLQNKENALKVLKSRLHKIKQEQQTEKLEELKGEKINADFGSQIRTYTLQPYKLVKDHRTNYEESNPEKVFDGEIEGFAEAFLKTQT